MAVAELARPAVEPQPIRRFFLPDMDRHPWLVARLTQLYGISERQAIGWFRSLVESPEFHFMFQEHSVGCFEVTRQHTLAVRPILTERFVWCSDPTSEEQQAEACRFYADAAVWAKNKDIDTIIVEENSDVPHEMVRKVEKLGRVLEQKRWFAKVG